jgi:RNA-directed DNA polymerase
VIPRYLGTIGGDRWVFKARARDRQEQWRDYYLYRLETTKIVRHTKVQGRASPDAPALVDYWTQRQTKYGKTCFPADSKLYRVAKRQGWKCPICHDHLFNGERIHTHHVQQVAKGGSDSEDNPLLVHLECHGQIHGGHARLRCGGLEPYDG